MKRYTNEKALGFFDTSYDSNAVSIYDFLIVNLDCVQAIL